MDIKSRVNPSKVEDLFADEIDIYDIGSKPKNQKSPTKPINNATFVPVVNNEITEVDEVGLENLRVQRGPMSTY